MKYIDLHCDTVMQMYQNNMHKLRQNDLHVDLEKLKKSDYMLQCFAMFVIYDTGNPLETCLEMIDKYYLELSYNRDLIKPVFCYNDIIENNKNSIMSSLLTIEEGGVILNKLEHLRNFYRLGVRMITLTWNFENGIANPNILYRDPNKNFYKPNLTEGLTLFGIEMVKEMEQLGMVIDVSHLSDKGFYDVLQHTTKPFIASHSNARSVCPHVRNLTDDMIIKLAKRGGVMGMNYCGAFLNDETKISSVKDIIKHINYIKDLAGIDCIALGSDFDGIEKDIEIKDASFMYLLTNELINNGYSQEDIEKIMYKNALRVFKEILK